MIPAHQDTGHLEWFQPRVTGDVPQRRSGHSLTASGSNVWMFGGLDHSLPPGPTSDLCVLQLGNEGSQEMEWMRPNTLGVPPLERWHHSTTLYEKNKLVIFGGFHSSTNRFNDVHVFDTITLSWLQPIDGACDFTPRGNHVPPQDTHPGVPTPRGGHTACLDKGGDKLYVFGGYGGMGYSRRDFNDVFILDIGDGWTWSKVNAKGTLPEPRSGHSGVMVNDDLVVFGGRNSATNFNDLCIFDTLEATWSEVTTGWGPARWNHSAVAVAAIPNWKVFVFGGQTSPDENDVGFAKAASKNKFLKQQAFYLNDVAVLDTGGNQWAVPECNGAPPSARSGSEVRLKALNASVGKRRGGSAGRCREGGGSE